jgi:uncharacterized protein YjbJ (UPF0337 family)
MHSLALRARPLERRRDRASSVLVLDGAFFAQSHPVFRREYIPILPARLFVDLGGDLGWVGSTFESSRQLTAVVLSREHGPTGAFAMNKDRIAGVAKQATGAIEETAGKTLGDAKLVVEGWNKKAEGKIQNAVGGAKDVLKETSKT